MFSPRVIAVFDTLIPPGEVEGLPGLMESGFEAFYRGEFREKAPLPMRLAFRFALFFAIWGAPLLIGRLPTLGRLKQDDRERALLAMGKSRVYVIRQLLLLLKTTVTFDYGAQESVRRHLGYPEQFDGGLGVGLFRNGGEHDAL